MLPVRLVLDTNVIVSAAIKESGLQRTLFKLALTKPAMLFVSNEVLEEYAEVLHRPYLEISKGLRLQMLQYIKNKGHLVSPIRKLDVCADLSDNIFLECADAARADYLITGNKKHFPAYWKGTKIVTAREFLDLAAQHLLG
jgi:putative PIN family toxin of toxin-antitoxin system